MNLPGLIVEGPRVFAATWLCITTLYVLLGLRKGWTLGRALATSAIGLHVLAAVYRLAGMATWGALLAAGLHPPSMHFTSARLVPYARLLVGLGWFACLAAVGLEGWRQCAAGPVSTLQRLGSWARIVLLPLTLFTLHLLSNSADDCEAVQWIDLWNGESWMEFRAQATATEVQGRAPLKRVSFVPPQNGSGVLGIDARGSVWHWDPLKSQPLPDTLPRSMPVRVTVPWYRGSCSVGLDGRAWCEIPASVSGNTVTFMELWQDARLATLETSDGCNGSSRLCAVSTDGLVRCWLAGADSKLAVERQAIGAAVVRAFTPHFGCRGCAAHGDGTVACWIPGAGGEGAVEGAVDGVGDVATLSSSRERACAVSQAGELRCWAKTAAGGDGASKPGWKSRRYLDGMRVSDVAVGETHTCAVSDSRVYCWGSNSWGQACGGVRSLPTEPVVASGIVDAVSVAVQHEQTCIVRTNGVAACCGKRYRWTDLGDARE